MENLFLRVFTVSAAVSLLLLPLLFCRRRMEKTYSPKTRWGLWLAVALVLLIVPWAPKPRAPVVVEAPAYAVTIPALPGGAPAAPKAQTGVPVGGQARPVPPTDHTSPDPPGTQAGVDTPAAIQTEVRPAAQRPTVGLTAILGGVWLAGLTLVLLRQGVWYLLARRRLLRASTPITGLEHYAAELDLEGRVTFYHCKAVPGPMTLGIWRPAVLLPPKVLAVAALRHELYHVKRRDVAYKVLLLCACALHWFNPLVWLMYRQADRDVEACCDAAVVAGRDSGYKRSYGELLLSAAAEPRALPFTTSFGGEAEQMKARLTQLFRPGKHSRSLVCLVLALAVALGSLVACESADPLTAGQAVQALEESITYENDELSFTLPKGYRDVEGWNIHISGRGEPEGMGGMSLHYLDDEVWEAGRTYTLDIAGELWPEITELAMDVSLEGESRTIDLLAVRNVGIMYVNETYRFTLRLPQSWAGRYMVEQGKDAYGPFWRFRQQAEAGEASGELFTIGLWTVGKEEAAPQPDAAKGRGVLGVRDRGDCWEVYRMTSPTWSYEHREGYEEMWGDVKDITPADFGFLTGAPEHQALTAETMPRLDYCGTESGLVVYHTDTCLYIHSGGVTEAFPLDQSQGGRVMGVAEVSPDESAVYFYDSPVEGAQGEDSLGYYRYDVPTGELRELTEMFRIGPSRMMPVGQEELERSGFSNGAALLSNVIQTPDGTMAGLTVDPTIGDTLAYLQLIRMRDSQWLSRMLLTPEQIPGPRDYTEPDWGFTLHLPESLEGQYYVTRGANYWLFYDKGQFGSAGGYLLGLWVSEEGHTGPGQALGEKGGLTYSLSTWPQDQLKEVPEERQEAYLEMLRAVEQLSYQSLDLSGVTRSDGDRWPFPYPEEGGTTILRGFEAEVHGHVDILAPEGVPAGAMARGVVTGIHPDPISGYDTVTVTHDGDRSSQYGNLTNLRVSVGDQVSSGEALGDPAMGNGQRFLQFGRTENGAERDPLDGEYRLWDFRPLTGADLTWAEDGADRCSPMARITIQALALGTPLEDLPPSLRATLKAEKVEDLTGEGAGLWTTYTAPGLELVTTQMDPDWAYFQEEERGREYLSMVRVTSTDYPTLGGLRVGETLEEAQRLGYGDPEDGRSYQAGLARLTLTADRGVITGLEAADGLRLVGNVFW